MNALQTSLDQVIQEHKELREMLASLREYLLKPRPRMGETGFRRWSAALTERVSVLRDKLTRHFQEEERSGFFGELSQAFPRAADAIDELQRQHAEILADLQGLLSAVIAYGQSRKPVRTSLRKWARAILDRLQQHESEETELTMQLINEDLGAQD